MAKKENEGKTGNVGSELDLLKGLIAGEDEEAPPPAEESGEEEDEDLEEDEEEEELDEEAEDEDEEVDDEELDDEEEEEDAEEDFDDEDEDLEDAEEDDADVEALKRQNRLLKKQLDEAHATPRRDADADEEEEADDPIVFDPHDFLPDDEAYDAALSSKEKLNELLNAVASQAVSFAVEQTLPRITKIVKKQVGEENANQVLVREYFDANRDLRSVRKFVATTFNEVIAENPNMSSADALTEAGNRVRAAIGTARTLGKRRNQTRRGGRRRSRREPSLPGGSRGRRSAAPPTGIADEIAAMKS